MSQKKYSRLLVPGRFQPPHKGHLETIRYALSLAEEVIVVVGSAQESHTLRNPLTAGERIELLRSMLSAELKPEDYARIYIVPVPDIAMNKVWVQYLKMLLPSFEGVVSGNELVLMLFEDMGLVAIRPPLYKPEECSGTMIRENILKEGVWDECIPESIRDKLKEIGFAERIRRLSKK
ncbi:MAG: nicotinamide-nucleotide adenylyltransferase [Acidilobaceae archaeon]